MSNYKDNLKIRIKPGQKWKSRDRNVFITIVKRADINGEGWMCKGKHSCHKISEFLIHHNYLLIEGKE